MPSYQTAGAAGFDLAASADVTIAPGAIVLIPTGLVIEVPKGHFLAIFARSSTPLKKGLVVANGVGVVDSDYCGTTDEVKIQIMNVTPATVEVKTGDRLAQGVVMPYVRVELEDGDGATAPSRGGFGSTG
jgi:dUTP pyrophosphatase